MSRKKTEIEGRIRNISPQVKNSLHRSAMQQKANKQTNKQTHTHTSKHRNTNRKRDKTTTLFDLATCTRIIVVNQKHQNDNSQMSFLIKTLTTQTNKNNLLYRADAKSTPSYSSDLHFLVFQNRPGRGALYLH